MPLGPDTPAGLAGTRGAAPGAKLKSMVYDEFGANNRTIGLMLYARTHAAGRPGRSAACISQRSAANLGRSEKRPGACLLPFLRMIDGDHQLASFDSDPAGGWHRLNRWGCVRCQSGPSRPLPACVARKRPPMRLFALNRDLSCHDSRDHLRTRCLLSMNPPPRRSIVSPDATQPVLLHCSMEAFAPADEPAGLRMDIGSIH